MLKLFKKRWVLFDQAVRPYKPYVTVDFGITSISPKNIIGLTFPTREIKNDNKLTDLRKSVELKGWNDKSPADLHLFLLPNGKYTVATGGNHRSYLSNKLEIPKIKAMVTILIPEKYITENIKSQLDYYSNKEDMYKKEALELNKFLQKQGTRRKNYQKEEKLYNDYCKLAENMNHKRDALLLSLAKFLNLLPKEEAD
ncbi:hypothetical protein [Niallia nealsonii]|uniref:ParB/Sulfiredoxin domain-containing protein n=1 Tax=Niallia nealsonii TaxID=115979 RepID=A0A2N0Z2V0_9BACI|nr:hypothetical protein [Niallia nealsonii]PKG23832.1 hypothetical protein CWS01_10050 [Niallia nealsonii]